MKLNKLTCISINNRNVSHNYLMESFNNYINATEIIQKLTETQCVMDDADIKFLLDSDVSKIYDCSSVTKSSGFTLLHKCVILTGKYPKLNNILCDNLQTNPQFTQSINETNERGWTALHLATRNSRTTSTEKTVKILIDAGANVNLQDHGGWSALHMATRNSRTTSTEGTVKLLINAGANVNLQTNNGWTALHMASLNSKNDSTEETVKILLAAGADVNLQIDRGWTALHMASGYSRINSTEETVKLLIDANANVNLQDNIGWTALHYASCYSKCYSSEETVKILLAAGANVNLQNNNRLTPLHLASNKSITSTEETINLLKAAEARIVYDKHIGECVICYSDSTTFVCNYNHNTCLECSTNMLTKFCQICSNEFVRSKLT